ncbi:cupin domain-containing protein [Cohnella xylanilytica]|uniref:Cupin domain-containing protein n=1 Tax=Cohnella xylanilytica TaxID=557555 RepID=A0A841U5E2_9BACL|nr:sugar phosphate nucleotidyltransferase [Cohnella xylanilytica]MBB6693240.1 cupin domain-containing protein [Cohnella xylanilytica]
MKLILLSGGSGKRLWPLSNDSRSKQFLKVLAGPEDRLESMVQRVWRQLEQVGLQSSAIVATSRSQVDILHNQIGHDVPVVMEPERRDTFPAIALAVSYIHSELKAGENEAVAVLPVDSYVEDHFFSKVLQLQRMVEGGGADLALIGVEPTFPSAKYGYIVPEEGGDKTAEFRKVSHFHEKPVETVAAELIARGALWNCGVFAFRIGWLVRQIEQLQFPTDYSELKGRYEELPKISFDQQIVEKTGNIAVLPYDGSWKDLGTWNTLTEEMDTPLIGKGTISVDSENTHLINELDIPVAILGVPNAVVAVSPDGVLVSDKAASPRLKEVLTFDQRLMYEECPWGWYRVLDYKRYGEETEMLTKRVSIAAGRKIRSHYHKRRQEVWTILFGEGEVTVGGETRAVRAGDVVTIAPLVRHGIRAVSELELVEVQTGSEVTDEDIWEREE